MDFNENQDTQPIIPQSDPDTTYHFVGAGGTPEPQNLYAPVDESAVEPPMYQPEPAQAPPEAPSVQPPVSHSEPVAELPKKKPRKKSSRGLRKALAWAAALGLLVTGCCATAWMVNRRWEARTDQLSQQLAALQTQVSRLESVNASLGISNVANSDALTPSQVFAKNERSVVSISNYAMMSTGWGGGAAETLAGTGSGFVLSADGYVLTNYHVVEGASAVTVTETDGDTHDATLVGYDQSNDVALLKVEATDLVPVTVGSSDSMLVGDMVVAIGNPLGELTSTTTVGYISGKDRTVNTDGSIIMMLQTDAAINSGNSGGPLFNMYGEVIGITSAKYSGSTSSGASIEGIGFAIPMDDVMSMIEDFKEYGYWRNQAYLGVEVYAMDEETADAYSLPLGSYVSGVTAGSAAEKAGVQPKDIITALGEYTVTDNVTLTAALRRFAAGEQSTITVFRGGQYLVLDIVFDEKPQDLTTDQNQGNVPDTGDYDEWYDYFYRYFGSPNP